MFGMWSDNAAGLANPYDATACGASCALASSFLVIKITRKGSGCVPKRVQTT